MLVFRAAKTLAKFRSVSDVEPKVLLSEEYLFRAVSWDQPATVM